MRLEVPLIPPSGNELRRKYRTVFAYRDLRMAWEKATHICTGGSFQANVLRYQAIEAWACKNKIKLEITVHRPKVLDDDNLMAGLKPVLDALAKNGFIMSDGPQHIEVPLPKIVLSRKRRTIIEITPA